MSKGFTTLEQLICIVTGQKFDTGNLLIDKKLREQYDMYTTTGYGFSPEVVEKFEEGYVALIAIDVTKSPRLPNGNLDPVQVCRTGEIAYIKKHVLAKFVPTLEVDKMAFTEPEVLLELSQIPIQDENTEDNK